MGILAVLRGRALAAAALLALAGCTFHRTVTNAFVGELETLWIRPGVTTLDEVIARLGMPPSIQGVDGYASDALHYVSLNGVCGKFEAGFIVTPTISFSRESDAEDILILFDDDRRVKLVSRTRVRMTSPGRPPQIELVEFREAGGEK